MRFAWLGPHKNKEQMLGRPWYRHDISVSSISYVNYWPDCGTLSPCSKYWSKSPLKYPVGSICVRPASWSTGLHTVSSRRNDSRRPSGIFSPEKIWPISHPRLASGRCPGVRSNRSNYRYPMLTIVHDLPVWCVDPLYLEKEMPRYTCAHEIGCLILRWCSSYVRRIHGSVCFVLAIARN